MFFRLPFVLSSGIFIREDYTGRTRFVESWRLRDWVRIVTELRSTSGMRKLIEFLRNDHIQAALVSGLCIIILALFFKKYLHMADVPAMEAAVPALAFTAWEVFNAKHRGKWFARPLFWNSIMLLITIAIIVRRLYFM
ncbi:MAG: hypothetical protein KKA42_11195 [candidate division Zixibacteria bacterium]|nr:hypothetical protein [candidate division Zixibacteria bacterium]